VDQLPTLDELKVKTAEVTTQPASNLSPEAEQNFNRLHGMPLPVREIMYEQPWHRTAAYFFATGVMSTPEVAQACNKDNRTVRNLLRQPWFQERVTQLLAQNGGKDIMALFKAEQFNTLAVLLDLRDAKSTPAPVKFNVCRDILDRTLGKPVQRIETEDKTQSDDPVAEARRLEEELARSRER
jgi:hypothetical protein